MGCTSIHAQVHEGGRPWIYCKIQLLKKGPKDQDQITLKISQVAQDPMMHHFAEASICQTICVRSTQNVDNVTDPEQPSEL